MSASAMSGSRRRSTSITAAAMAVILVAISACAAPPAAVPSTAPASAGTSSAQPTTAPSEPVALKDVSLVLDYLMDAAKGPLVLGKEKGIFEAHGINLTITEGTGSGDSARFVANGTYDFGLASASAAFTSIANGVPIVMLANHQPRNLSAILVKADSNIMTPKDLTGRSLAVGSQGNDQFLLPATLRAVGLSQDDVKVVLVNESAKTPLWLSGQVDANLNPIDGLPDMMKADPTLKARAFLVADYGLSVLQQGLITTVPTVKNNPDLVREMVAAYAESYLYAAKHRDEMISTVVAAYPDVTAESLGQQFDIVFSSVETVNNAGKPFGYIAPKDLDQMIAALKEGGILKTELPNDAFYTDQFIGTWDPLPNLASVDELVAKLTSSN
jgi:NitT/TauT family transport system substrate-binding protein